MKILVMGASSSRRSINKALATHAGQRFQAEHRTDAELDIVDLNDFEMPIYSIDREREGGIPDAAHAFLARIAAADALIISFAEHNGSYTAAFKNVYDWASRVETKVYQGKPLVLLSTSPGGRGGANVMRSALGGAPHFGAVVVGDLSVPRFNDHFDRDAGVLTSPEHVSALGALLGALSEQLSGGSEPS